MRSHNKLSLALSAVAALAGCAPDGLAPAPEEASDAARSRDTAATGLTAGAAEEWLDLPIGVPLAAYTGRLKYSLQSVDSRTSPYTTEFIPSAGSQTRIPVKAIWLENNGQHVVFIKVDIGYAFDGILFGLHKAISDATGIDMTDKVVFATSHSHSSYGDFSHDASLYLGSDQFNTEIFTRLVTQAADVARQAYENRAPAAIGVGFDPGFDPIGVDAIFRDRRGENDDLVGPDGQILGPGYKDPRLTLLRIDRSQGTTSPDDDEPLALIHSFGIHGTIMGGDNVLTSVEASGHIDLKVQERFETPVVVMHLQGAAGDQSPAGFQDAFARMETLGEMAAPKVKSLWDRTRTKSGSVPLELLTRSIRQERDEMRITRQGTADYYYTPYSERYKGDDVIYDEAGKVISPIDEFNSENGAALCSDDPSLVVVGKLFGWKTTVPPYNTCGNVEEIVRLMDLPLFDFDLGWVTAPLQTAQTTVISTFKLGPVPIVSTDGTNVEDNLVMGIFPGEPLSLYSDTFRKELRDVHGYKYGVTIGYAQDHEGYLLTLEDWLAGGYEPEINQWGPIQGEYILEQAVALAGQFGIDNPAVPATSTEHNVYEYFPLEPAVPDVTADAGTVPARVPGSLYAWDGVMPTSAQPPAQVARVTGIAHFLWKGGDAVVDLPEVTLERETSPGSNSWTVVRHPSGRPWSNGTGKIMLTYTPDPLRDNGQQTHYWYATFQAVSDEPTLEYSAGLPLGRYRFRVDGEGIAAAGGSFPWSTKPYTVYSDPFQLVANTSLAVSAGYASGALSVTASYPPAERGFRLISMNASDEQESNPLNRGSSSTATGSIAVYTESGTLLWQSSSVSFTTNRGSSSATVTPSALSAGTYKVVVTDLWGNLGQGSLTVN